MRKGLLEMTGTRDWQTLIATIMSAQTRDEVTIPAAEKLFERYNSLEKLSKARASDVLKIIIL